MAKYLARDVQAIANKAKPGRPARPYEHLRDSLKYRVSLAWGVLKGRYDALDWEDDATT